MGTPLPISEVPGETPYIQYIATSGQTVFPYPFVITQDSDLVVVYNGVTLETDQGYSLTGQGNDTGGNVTFTLPAVTGDIVTLFRDISISRLTQFSQNGGFSSAAFNAEFNNIYLIMQQLQQSGALSLSVPNTNVGNPVTVLAPDTYANKFLGFDANGNPTPVALTSSGAITTTVLAPFLNLQQTAAEIAAGVVPSNEAYPPGDIRRYGGVVSVDCSAKVTAAASCNSEVVFPPGAWVITSAPTVPFGVAITALAGSSFTGPGATALGLLLTDERQTLLTESFAQGAGFYNSQKYAHAYGGPSMTGGRNSLEVQSALIAATSASNFNRNYVAGAFQCQSVSGDGGTNATSAATSQGAVFGLNGVGILDAGSSNLLNVTAAEFDVAAMAGTSVFFRSGIQVSELANSAVRGAGYDGGIVLTGQTPNVGFLNGFLVCKVGGANPIAPTGNVFATQDTATCANGINLTSYTFTGSTFVATGFDVLGSGSEMDVGLIGTANTYLFNFHTGAAAAPNYDSRITANGGTGANGGGNLLINSAGLGFYDAAGTGVSKITGFGTPTAPSLTVSFPGTGATLAQCGGMISTLLNMLLGLHLIGS
jgi:hypothetical protein